LKKDKNDSCLLFRGVYLLPAVVIAVGVFGWIIRRVNTALFLWINSHNSGRLDIIMTHITSLGDGLILCLLLFFLFPRRADITILSMEAYITSGLAVNILKPLFDLPRPPALFSPELIHVIGSAYKRGSFPSGHTASAVAAGLVLFLLLRSPMWRFCAILLGLLVGYSRVYVGVHFPLDVYAGGLLGALTAWVAARRQKKIRKWLNDLSLKGRRALRNCSMLLMLAAGLYLLLWYPEVMPGVELSAKLLGMSAALMAAYQLAKDVEGFGIRGQL